MTHVHRARLLRSASMPVFAALIIAISMLDMAYAQQPPSIRYFPETGKIVKGRFLQYWDERGGLAQQGYPISEEINELREWTDASGKHKQFFIVQYFERAIFEYHPE